MEIYDIQKNQGLEAKKAGIKPVDGNKKLSKVDAAKLVNRLYEEAVKDRKEQQLKRIENLKKECIKPVIKKKSLKMVKKSAMLHGAIQGANMVMKNIHDICSLKISANNQTSCIKEHKPTSMAIRLSNNRLAREGGNLVTKKQVYKENNGMLAKIQNAKPKVKCWSDKVQQKRDTKHQHMIK